MVEIAPIQLDQQGEAKPADRPLQVVPQAPADARFLKNLNVPGNRSLSYAAPQASENNGGFFKSTLWKVMKFAIPTLACFLFPPLGLFGAALLSGTLMGGMTVAEKLSTQGNLTGKDCAEIGIDFACGFIGGPIGKLLGKIPFLARTASTFRGNFVRGLIPGAVTGGVTGAAHSTGHQLLDTGDVDTQKLLVDVALGAATGGLVGGTLNGYTGMLKNYFNRPLKDQLATSQNLNQTRAERITLQQQRLKEYSARIRQQVEESKARTLELQHKAKLARQRGEEIKRLKEAGKKQKAELERTQKKLDDTTAREATAQQALVEKTAEVTKLTGKLNRKETIELLHYLKRYFSDKGGLSVHGDQCRLIATKLHNGGKLTDGEIAFIRQAHSIYVAANPTHAPRV